jgi:outer membrane lipoprotein-sorting protein
MRLALLLVIFLCLTACKSQSDTATNDNALSETVVSSTPPFQTKEPERYQATRVITITTTDGGTVVTKTSIARDGDLRRHESETASKRVVYLDLPDARIVLLPDEKVYADVAAETGAPTSEDEEFTPERLLHTETGSTSYQKLGTEVVGGRNANKYRIVVNSSGAGNVSVSDTLIWIDEALNMPIRSEMSSAGGTRITTELTDIVLDVDKRIFQVPEGYEKIAFSEFRHRLTETAATKNSQPRP